MKTSLMLRLVVPALVLASAACGHSSDRSMAAPSQQTGAAQIVPAPTPLSAEAGLDDHAIGAPLVLGNLSVFPVFASKQEDIGEFTTLDAALEAKTAEVREVDASAAEGSSRSRGDGAQVNTLVIENHGKLSLLVLAGTVVKGGKQDRQIGADFVIESGKTVPVDAFCVEHGRWNASRDGVATDGKFKSEGVLAQAKVRSAGQYEHDQSKVWESVAEVNRSTKKEAASGTLMATLDDRDIATERAAIVTKVKGFLSASQPSTGVVGIAYAVDGHVRAVRWFMNHKLFTLYSDTLVETAALEAVTARAGKSANAPPPAAVAPAAVSQFVDDVGRGSSSVEAAPSAAANVNHMKKGETGYGSEAVLKGPGKPRAVTSDFVSK